MSGPEWEYAGSVYLPKWHYTAYRDETIGVEMRVYTRRTWSPFLRNHKELYFIDGSPRGYSTMEELLTALAHRPRKESSQPTYHAPVSGNKAFAH